MKPYLKWPGGKAALAPAILAKLPPGRLRYVEPFVGAGAVYFALWAEGRIATAVLADTNARLIACHQAVRDDVGAVLHALDALPVRGVTLAHYEAERDALNAWDGTPTPEHAARFIWLNRACFNGVYRENRDGGFNVPWNKSPTVSIPDEIVLRACSMALADAALQVSDFRSTLDYLQSSIVAAGGVTRPGAAGAVVVYADPPYVPVSQTARFTQYTAGGFGAQDQEDLARGLCLTAQLGARVIASNADVPYVRDLYGAHGFTLHEVTARRAINRDPDKRGPVGELLLEAQTHTCSVAHTRVTVPLPSTPPAKPRQEPPMPPKDAPVIVRHVRSNIKGPIDAQLDQFTLIVGRNGQHKSAHVNAVEFALTRAVSDVVGRALVDGAGPNAWMIGDMVAPNEDVWATVQLSDGEKIEAIAERKRDGGIGKAKSPTGGRPDAFPLRTVRDALAGSPDTIRQYLLQQAAAAITLADVRKRFTATQAEAFDVERTRSTIDGLGAVDQLLAVLEASKKRLRTARARAADQEAYAKSRAADLGPEPTDAELEAAKAAADAYSTPIDVAGPQARAADAVAAFQRAKAEAEAAQAAVTGEMHVISGKVAGLKSVRAAIQWHIDWFARNATQLSTGCACCSAGTLTPEGAQAQAAAVDGAVGVLEEQLRAMRDYERLAHERDRLRAVAVAAVDALEKAQAQAAERVTVADGADPRTLYLNLRRAADGWVAVRAAREQAEAAMHEADAAEALAHACKQVVSDLLDNAVAAFEARVQAFLPPTDVFRLRLRDGDREVCRVGFERDGQIHTALSGAEWARLCLALACAVARGPGPVVVVPEERAFDPKTLRDVLVAFRKGVQRLNVPVQIIWTSPIKPAGRSTGWTVIDLDAATPTSLDETRADDGDEGADEPTAGPGAVVGHGDPANRLLADEPAPDKVGSPHPIAGPAIVWEA